jgi:hypothetical protein
LRLLEAALADAEVPQVSAEDAARIAQIEAFEALPLTSRWRRLLALNPELAAFEFQAGEGEYGSGWPLTCAATP